MALPIVNGKSWLTGSAYSPPISLPLPTPYVMRYVYPLGDYATCGISSHYQVDLLGIGTSSIFLTKNTDTLLLQWYINNAIAPGVIDRIRYVYHDGFEIELGAPMIYYALTTTGQQRYGMIVNPPISGSPHLSFEAGSKVSGTTLLKGDIWADDYGKIKFMDSDVVGRPTTSSFLTARLDTLANITSFYGSGVVGSQVVGAHRVYANNWLNTANSPINIGKGFKNWDWDGGIYMSDPDTVAVWGQKNFQVSGSLTIYGDVIAEGVKGNIRVYKSSFQLDTGSIFFTQRMTGRNLYMNGVSASFVVNNGLVSTLLDQTSSYDPSTAMSFDGDWYLYRSATPMLHVRASGSWFPLISSSDSYDYIDGGRF